MNKDLVAGLLTIAWAEAEGHNWRSANFLTGPDGKELSKQRVLLTTFQTFLGALDEEDPVEEPVVVTPPKKKGRAKKAAATTTEKFEELPDEAMR